MVIQKGIISYSCFYYLTLFSLAGTIRFQRPDLLPDEASPSIPLNPADELSPGILLQYLTLSF